MLDELDVSNLAAFGQRQGVLEQAEAETADESQLCCSRRRVQWETLWFAGQYDDGDDDDDDDDDACSLVCGKEGEEQKEEEEEEEEEGRRG